MAGVVAGVALQLDRGMGDGVPRKEYGAEPFDGFLSVVHTAGAIDNNMGTGTQLAPTKLA